jgi:hypothetical protein
MNENPNFKHLEIQFKEEPIKDVISWFVKGYKKKVQHYEWYIDPTKGTIIFKLYMDKEKQL